MGNTMKTVMGIISIAIAFIVFPIVLDGVTEITGHAGIATFTGLSAVAAIAPLIIFVGLLAAGGLGIYQGVRGGRKSKRG